MRSSRRKSDGEQAPASEPAASPRKAGRGTAYVDWSPGLKVSHWSQAEAHWQVDVGRVGDVKMTW